VLLRLLPYKDKEGLAKMKRKSAIALVMALIMMLGLLGACGKTEEKKFVVLEDDFAKEDYSIAFRKNDIALAAKVQSILDEMAADGTTDAIDTEWFGTPAFLKESDPIEDLSNPTDDSLDKVLQAGKLIVGLDDSLPPMGYRDSETGEIVGYDISLAEEVCKRLGVTMVLQPIDWNAKEGELAAGRIDCVWNGMTVTPQRAEEMALLRPYLANRQVMIVPEGSSIKSKAGLAGKKLGLQTGSSAVDALNSFPDAKASLAEVVEYGENLTAFLDLKIGRIDVLLVDEVVGRYLISHE
jgi:ABC-type amino acid transport substrate-binding protein